MSSHLCLARSGITKANSLINERQRDKKKGVLSAMVAEAYGADEKLVEEGFGTG